MLSTNPDLNFKFNYAKTKYPNYYQEGVGILDSFKAIMLETDIITYNTPYPKTTNLYNLYLTNYQNPLRAFIFSDYLAIAELNNTINFIFDPQKFRDYLQHNSLEDSRVVQQIETIHSLLSIFYSNSLTNNSKTLKP